MLLLGIEPNLRWRTFTTLVVDLARELGVEMMITLGSLLADVPHTRPSPVTGGATDPELIERLGLQRSRYEGPTGIVGVLHDACNTSHIQSVSLWAAVPHYVSLAPSPRAALAQPDRTPSELRTPESYLGYARIGNYDGSPIRPNRPAQYRFPAALPKDSFAYAGTWTVDKERILAGPGARLRFNFLARSVHLVLTGRGVVHVKLNGRALPDVHVTADQLYTLATQKQAQDATLELSFTPGLSAYAFTFG